MSETKPVMSETKPVFQDPSWKANFRGQCLGYFATAEEAMAAVDAAIDEEDADAE